MATEIAIFKLNPGQNPKDANSPAAKVLQDTFDTVLSQKGAQRAYWGIEHENPDTFRLFIDWDSYEDHMNWVKDPAYKPFVDHFGKLVNLSAGYEMYHANLVPHPPSAVLSSATSPATEILVMTFPQDYSQSDQDTFVTNMQGLIKCVEGNATTYTANAGGWIIEDQPIPPKPDASEEEKKVHKKKGEMGKAYAAFIGWKSVQDHLDFRETEEFKKNIHLLRGAKDLKGVKVVHYHGTEVQGPKK